MVGGRVLFKLIVNGLFALAFILLVAIAAVTINYENIDKLANTGDFFNGWMGPILSFVTFMGVLYTIKIQQDALVLTQDEIRRQMKAAEDQTAISETLRFEKTFFELIGLLNSNITSFQMTVFGHPETIVFHGRQAISHAINDDSFGANKLELSIIPQTIQNILVLIDRANVSKPIYVGILRSQLTENEMYITEKFFADPSFVELDRLRNKYSLS